MAQRQIAPTIRAWGDSVHLERLETGLEQQMQRSAERERELRMGRRFGDYEDEVDTSFNWTTKNKKHTHRRDRRSADGGVVHQYNVHGHLTRNQQSTEDLADQASISSVTEKQKSKHENHERCLTATDIDSRRDHSSFETGNMTGHEDNVASEARRKVEKKATKNPSDGSISIAEVIRHGSLETSLNAISKKRKVSRSTETQEVVNQVHDIGEISESVSSKGKRQKIRKSSRESPNLVHTVHAHKSHSSPSVVSRETSQDDKSQAPEIVTFLGKTHLAPSKTFQPVEESKAALSRTVVRNAIGRPSIEERSEKWPGTETIINPPRVTGSNVSRAGGKKFNETVILPPKKIIQAKPRAPTIATEIAYPNQTISTPTLELVADKERNTDLANTELLKSGKSRPKKINAGKKRAKKAEATEDIETLSQVAKSIRKTTSFFENLFSPEIPTLPDQSGAKQKKKYFVTADGSPIQAVTGQNATVIVSRSSTSVGHSSSADEPVNMVVSDEWEVGPGKIRGIKLGGDDAEMQENIAFSWTYISSRPSGINISGTIFQVVYLKPRTGWGFLSGDEERKLNIFSVADGRVTVMLDGQRFKIGKGGMWKVRIGEQCIVRNKEKEEAVVHVVRVD